MQKSAHHLREIRGVAGSESSAYNAAIEAIESTYRIHGP